MVVVMQTDIRRIFVGSTDIWKDPIIINAEPCTDGVKDARFGNSTVRPCRIRRLSENQGTSLANPRRCVGLKISYSGNLHYETTDL